jgi:hypothetical protein
LKPAWKHPQGVADAALMSCDNAVMSCPRAKGFVIS